MKFFFFLRKHFWVARRVGRSRTKGTQKKNFTIRRRRSACALSLEENLTRAMATAHQSVVDASVPVSRNVRRRISRVAAGTVVAAAGGDDRDATLSGTSDDNGGDGDRGTEARDAGGTNGWAALPTDLILAVARGMRADTDAPGFVGHRELLCLENVCR
jgi:hypothetical protein